MNKKEFLLRLKEDLSSLTDEERENALKYYEEYFEDSGEETVGEDNSPKAAADKIKESVLDKADRINKAAADGAERIREEIGTENFFKPKEEVKHEIKLEILENLDEFNKEPEKEVKEEKAEEIKNYTYANADEAVKETEDKSSGQAEQAEKIPENQNGGQNYNNEYRKLKNSNSAMKIILLICFSPIWIPVAMGLGCALFGLLMAFFSVSLALGCAALSGIVAAGAGVFSVGYGLAHIFSDFSRSIMLISSGLIATGVGIILAYLLGKLTVAIFKYEVRFLSFLGGKIFRRNRNKYASYRQGA
jgi:uncharacterized membrane protein